MKNISKSYRVRDCGERGSLFDVGDTAFQTELQSIITTGYAFPLKSNKFLEKMSKFYQCEYEY